MPHTSPDPPSRPATGDRAEAAGALAYVALASARPDRADAIAVVDVGATGPAGGRVVGVTTLPGGGNELRRLGWSTVDGAAPRRLLAPGLRSSRIHVLDCDGDPRRPALVRVIAPEELAQRAGYAAPFAVLAARDAVYVSALGAADGEGPGGVLTLDPDSLGVRGAWEGVRGPQRLAGDVARHDAHAVVVTGEWGAPRLVLDGVSLECLAAGAYGHALHVWDARTHAHRQRIELGAEQQMVLDLRPAHSPRRAYGFACTAVSVRDLSSAVYTWYLDREGDAAGATGAGGTWRAARVIEIPAEPAPRADLPPLLRRFGAVPPLATALALSRDDRFLYVACWGTGELRQYDVCDPFNPVLTGSARLGGVAWRAPHPSVPGVPLDGGPCAVELSADGRRVYVTSSFLSSWDGQLYPDAGDGWMAALDAGVDGGLVVDAGCFVRFEEGMRPREVRVPSSSSYVR